VSVRVVLACAMADVNLVLASEIEKKLETPELFCAIAVRNH